eukprot:551909-Pelagomonas_calceolata.AAC.1
MSVHEGKGHTSAHKPMVPQIYGAFLNHNSRASCLLVTEKAHVPGFAEFMPTLVTKQAHAPGIEEFMSACLKKRKEKFTQAKGRVH